MQGSVVVPNRIGVGRATIDGRAHGLIRMYGPDGDEHDYAVTLSTMGQLAAEIDAMRCSIAAGPHA